MDILGLHDVTADQWIRAKELVTGLGQTRGLEIVSERRLVGLNVT